MYPSSLLLIFFSGHCGANPCDDYNGYINLYITRKAYRGMGIGRQLYEKALQSLGDRNVVLNAAWDRQDMYKTAGFMISSFKLHIYLCPMRSVNLDPAGKGPMEPLTMESIKDIDIKLLYEYDEKINLSKRFEDIKQCLQRSKFGLAVVEDGVVKGWGALSKGDLGYALSPVYADTTAVAKALIYGLLEKVPEDAQIEVAFPASNAGAQTIFDDLNIKSGVPDPNMRMYSKRDVNLPLQMLFCPINYHTVLF